MTARRPRLSPRATLATLLVAACLTPSDSGSRFGELRVQPAFTSGEEPQALGVSVDSIRTVIARSGSGEIVADTVMPYRTGSLAWVLELESTADDMIVTMSLRGAGNTLYDGERAVTVSQGPIGTAPTEDVGVDYVGGTLAARVALSPPRLVFSTIGLARSIAAAAYDAQDQPIEGKTFTWQSDDPAVAGVDATGLVIASAVGATSIHASTDGVSGTASVLVDTLLARSSAIVTDSASLRATASATTRVLVTVLDAEGRSVGASAGTVALVASLGSLSDVIDHADGTYTATFTAGTVTGIAEITGTLDGLVIADTASVTLVANTADVTTTTIEADSAALDADGASTTRITVTVRDEHGDAVGSGGASVTLSSTLGTLTGDVTDHGDGTYTQTLTAGTVAGEAVITGTLNGAAIDDDARVTFRPLDATATTTTIDADSAAIDADGTSTTRITVTVRDEHGNPVGTGGAAVTLSSTLGTLTGDVTDHGDGTYTQTLTAGTVAGEAVITGTLDGAAIDDDAHVTFRPLDATATTTTIDADSAAIDADGVSTTRITVTVRDEHGNPVGTGGAAVTLSSTLGTLTGDVTDHGDGTYTQTLTAGTVAGEAVITGTLNGAAIDDDARVSFRPLEASTTTTTIDADSAALDADGTATTRITVTVRDEHGNAVGTGGAAVTLSSTLGTLTGDVTDHGDGTYTQTLTAGTVAGEAVITGMLNGAAIEDDARVLLRAGEPVLTLTTITSDSTSIAANGVSTALITVSVVDVHGNLVGRSAGTVELTASVGLLGDVTDHGDGRYTAPFRADTALYMVPEGDGTTSAALLVIGVTADTAVITGTLAGETIPDSARVELRHEPGDPSNTTIEADSASVAAGSGSTWIIVTLRDAAGNRVWASSAVVTLHTTAGELTAVTNNGDGTYRARLKAPAGAGVAVITGTLDGSPITDTAEVEIRPPA